MRHKLQITRMIIIETKIKEEEEKERIVKSNYTKHLLNIKHDFNNKLNILHVVSKGRLLSALESLEINQPKNKNILLND